MIVESGVAPSDPTVVAVLGAKRVDEVPGIAALGSAADLRFARNQAELRDALSGAEVLFGWEFPRIALEEAWDCADRLRWIHWGGAGVDPVLFPELIDSEVTLTNSRGVFDGAMAEYVLGVILALAKRFPETMALQQQRIWRHRLTERVSGKRVLVVGVGSIGRAIARILRCAGMEVTGLGRSGRPSDPDFGRVHAQTDLDRLLPDADFVVVVAPLTEETRGLFGVRQFRAMKRTARFINVGRGVIADEDALVTALEEEQIAGAALDVFEREPLPSQSPLWRMPSVIVSPHMSGDFAGYQEVLAELFVDNFHRFRSGDRLLNVVDKKLGYPTQERG